MLPNQNEEISGRWWGQGSGLQRRGGSGIKIKKILWRENSRIKEHPQHGSREGTPKSRKGTLKYEDVGKSSVGDFIIGSWLPPRLRRRAPRSGVHTRLGQDLTTLTPVPSSQTFLFSEDPRDQPWDQLQEGSVIQCISQRYNVSHICNSNVIQVVIKIPGPFFKVQRNRWNSS